MGLPVYSWATATGLKPPPFTGDSWPTDMERGFIMPGLGRRKKSNLPRRWVRIPATALFPFGKRKDLMSLQSGFISRQAKAILPVKIRINIAAFFSSVL